MVQADPVGKRVVQRVPRKHFPKPPEDLECEVVQKVVRLGDGREVPASVKVYRTVSQPTLPLRARSAAYESAIPTMGCSMRRSRFDG